MRFIHANGRLFAFSFVCLFIHLFISLCQPICIYFVIICLLLPLLGLLLLLFYFFEFICIWYNNVNSFRLNSVSFQQRITKWLASIIDDIYIHIYKYKYGESNAREVFGHYGVWITYCMHRYEVYATEHY